MIRVAISVEGQTEMEFCKKVLTPFFRSYKIEMIPIVVATSRDKCGAKHKGGCINMDRIKSEIERLLHNFDHITTFYDFYGFQDRPTDDVDGLEQKIFELFNSKKLTPYVQQYEFETLLFSKPEYYEEYFGDSRVTEKMKQIITIFICTFCITGCMQEKQGRAQHTAFKGMELNSWRGRNKQWCFSLLVGTNRNKSISEITNPKTKIIGVDNLKRKLAKLPIGENVFWVNYAKEPVPSAIINDLMKYSKEIKIKLHKL